MTAHHDRYTAGKRTIAREVYKVPGKMVKRFRDKVVPSSLSAAGTALAQ
jgi:hypothetical protein